MCAFAAAVTTCGALRAAWLLEDLTSWQTGSVDDMDYGRRLEGFKALTSAQWAVLGRRKVCLCVCPCARVRLCVYVCVYVCVCVHE